LTGSGPTLETQEKMLAENGQRVTFYREKNSHSFKAVRYFFPVNMLHYYPELMELHDSEYILWL